MHLGSSANQQLQTSRIADQRAVHDLDGATWRIRFKSTRFTLGTWMMRPDTTGYASVRTIKEHTLVFPRFINWLRISGSPPFVADGNKLLAFNRAQTYSREPIHPEGDLGYLFVPSVTLLDEVLSSRGRTGPSADYRPFTFQSVPADRVSVLLQRKIFEHLDSDEPTDDLLIEEASVEILNRALDSGSRERGMELPERKRIELVERVRETMGRTFWQNMSLSELAERVAISIYHLSRVFRRETGMTLHSYREELRLREGAYQIADGTTDLSALALDLGYSSHSHFTHRFRTRFGMTPSQFRDRPATHQIRELLSRLAQDRSASS